MKNICQRLLFTDLCFDVKKRKVSSITSSSPSTKVRKVNMRKTLSNTSPVIRKAKKKPILAVLSIKPKVYQQAINKEIVNGKYAPRIPTSRTSSGSTKIII